MNNWQVKDNKKVIAKSFNLCQNFSLFAVFFLSFHFFGLWTTEKLAFLRKKGLSKDLLIVFAVVQRDMHM